MSSYPLDNSDVQASPCKRRAISLLLLWSSSFITVCFVAWSWRRCLIRDISGRRCVWSWIIFGRCIVVSSPCLHHSGCSHELWFNTEQTSTNLQWDYSRFLSSFLIGKPFGRLATAAFLSIASRPAPFRPNKTMLTDPTAMHSISCDLLVRTSQADNPNDEVRYRFPHWGLVAKDRLLWEPRPCHIPSQRELEYTWCRF